MVFLNILYSAAAMGLLFLLLTRWFDTKFSILITLLTMTNPMVWYYGCVTEIYAFDLFFGNSLALPGLSPAGIYFTPLIAGL